jgi:hypothetical protein
VELEELIFVQFCLWIIYLLLGLSVQLLTVLRNNLLVDGAGAATGVPSIFLAVLGYMNCDCWDQDSWKMHLGHTIQ